MTKGANDDIRDFARQQLKKKQGFKTYLAVYVGVTGLVTRSLVFDFSGKLFLANLGYFWHGNRSSCDRSRCLWEQLVEADHRSRCRCRG